MKFAEDIAGCLLLAMPTLTDPSFHDSVVLVCHHDEDEGSMGLIVNRPMDLSVDSVLDDLNFKERHTHFSAPIFQGGPLEPYRGFVLHRSSRHPLLGYESNLPVCDDVHLATSRDILEEIAHGGGPRQFMLLLGYAGWSSGQLKQEIDENAWLVVPGKAGLLFDTPAEQRWSAAAASIGVQRQFLSEMVGHA